MRIKTATLKKMAERLAPVVIKKANLPTLSNVLIKVQDNELTIQGTNLEIFIKTKCEIEEAKDTTMLIDFFKLSKIIENAKSEEITIEEDTKSITIRAGKTKHKLIKEYSETDDFPTIELSKGESFTTNFTNISKCLHACSSDDLRKNMAGVLLSKSGYVATDGFRLIKVKKELPIENDIIVPTALAKILSTLDGDYEVRKDESAIFISNDNVEISGKLIDESFPNYDSVIPKDIPNSFEVKRQDLTEALKQVGFNADETTHRISFFINNGTMTVNAQTSESQSETEIEAKLTIGKEKTIEKTAEANEGGDPKEEETAKGNEPEEEKTKEENFSASFSLFYLQQLLSVFTDEILTFNYTNASKAFVVKNDLQTYLIMPVRVV